VQDTSAVVLNALYAARAALLPVFLAAPKPYLDSLAAALAGKPKHPLLHLHLGFLLGHFRSMATLAYATRIPRSAGLALNWFEDESVAVRVVG
jgi:hypothetical protein